MIYWEEISKILINDTFNAIELNARRQPFNLMSLLTSSKRKRPNSSRGSYTWYQNHGAKIMVPKQFVIDKTYIPSGRAMIVHLSNYHVTDRMDSTWLLAVFVTETIILARLALKFVSDSVIRKKTIRDNSNYSTKKHISTYLIIIYTIIYAF